jgi:hypothetical protein
MSKNFVIYLYSLLFKNIFLTKIKIETNLKNNI